jgi:starch synthase
MRIAMVASEINPLIKTGGLADVIYALSQELRKVGDDVICVLPFYKKVASSGKCDYRYMGSFDVNMNWRRQSAQIYSAKVNGLPFYMIGNDYYFGRDGVYGYDDDGETRKQVIRVIGISKVILPHDS